MSRPRLAHAITLICLVLLALTPVTPAATAYLGQSPTHESIASPMETPWGG